MSENMLINSFNDTENMKIPKIPRQLVFFSLLGHDHDHNHNLLAPFKKLGGRGCILLHLRYPYWGS